MKFDKQNKVAGVVLSQDGKRLATHTAEQIAVWDAQTLRNLGSHDLVGCRGMSFLPCGRRLAVVGRSLDGHMVRLLSASLKNVDAEYAIPSPTGFRPTFSRDGNVMAVGQNLIDLTGKNVVKTKAGLTGNVAFHPTVDELYGSLGQTEIATGSYWLDDGDLGPGGVPHIPPNMFAMAREYDEVGAVHPVMEAIHPIQEIAYAPSGKMVVIGYPNFVAFAEAKTLEFLPRKFFLGEIFGDHALARHDITRVVFGPKGLMAIAANVCYGQLSQLGAIAGRKLTSGVIVYDLDCSGKAPWKPISGPSTEVFYGDVVFTPSDLVVAGIDLTNDRRPFVNRYSL